MRYRVYKYGISYFFCAGIEFLCLLKKVRHEKNNDDIVFTGCTNGGLSK